MAAVVSTATATSLEGQAMEVLRELKQAEDAWIAAGLALDPPETRERRLSISTNLVNGSMSFDLTLPVALADSPNGYQITATPYIV